MESSPRNLQLTEVVFQDSARFGDTVRSIVTERHVKIYFDQFITCFKQCVLPI